MMFHMKLLMLFLALSPQFSVSLYRGTSKVAPDSVGATQQAAWDDCLARAKALQPTTTSKLSCKTPVGSLVTVPDPPSTATLSWSLSTQNTDGSAYVDPFGYVIQYGNAVDQLTQSIDVNDPAATKYVVTGLTAGSWFFCVRARNTSNVRSDCSGILSKTL